MDPIFKRDLFDVYERFAYVPHACLRLLQKQQALLTAEPFIQPPGAFFVLLTYLDGSGRHRSQIPYLMTISMVTLG